MPDAVSQARRELRVRLPARSLVGFIAATLTRAPSGVVVVPKPTKLTRLLSTVTAALHET